MYHAKGVKNFKISIYFCKSIFKIAVIYISPQELIMSSILNHHLGIIIAE